MFCIYRSTQSAVHITKIKIEVDIFPLLSENQSALTTDGPPMYFNLIVNIPVSLSYAV